MYLRWFYLHRLTASSKWRFAGFAFFLLVFHANEQKWEWKNFTAHNRPFHTINKLKQRHFVKIEIFNWNIQYQSWKWLLSHTNSWLIQSWAFSSSLFSLCHESWNKSSTQARTLWPKKRKWKLFFQIQFPENALKWIHVRVIWSGRSKLQHRWVVFLTYCDGHEASP